MEPKATTTKRLKTYSNSHNKYTKRSNIANYNEPMTTKDAVQFLIEGTLKWRVCRFCLTITSMLSEMDEILEVASSGALYQVTIRDMIASFYPFKLAVDPNLPNKICNKCLNKAINSYLFTQQCERSERALRNCFNDINDKFDKLDPLERVKKRGRQKINPNHNVLYADYKTVMSYADPVINIVNVGASFEVDNVTEINEFECPKCWQVLPNIESFVNHEKIHPKSMWYHCRLCGKSFVKHSLYKRHIKDIHKHKNATINKACEAFSCKECGSKTNEFGAHLQHMEKHKFKNVFEHLLVRNMDRLCGVCMDKGKGMVDLSETLHLHAGYPGLTGEKSLGTVIASIIPEMNTVHNYTGTKICETCLNHAITSYIFINKIRYTRNRLDSCISLMLDSLNRVENPSNNVIVEMVKDTILPITDNLREVDEYVKQNEAQNEDEIDESKLKVEVLEDEFRIESESSEDEDVLFKTEVVGMEDETTDINTETNGEVNAKIEYIDNPAKTATKKYVNKKLVMNGYQSKFTHNNVRDTQVDDVCSEFLTFKKKLIPSKRSKSKFTCPVCSKNFISDYFLKRHVLKHVNIKTKCKTCSLQFKSKFHLSEHMKMMHVASVRNCSACEICGRSFQNPKKLLIHKRTHTNKECQLCDKLFVSQKCFDSHLQRHALKFNTKSNRRMKTCSFCEKECSNNNELSLHVNKSHLQIKPYRCDMCEGQFYTEYNLCSHKRLHSLPSKEICGLCEKVFKSRKALVIHIRRHIGVKPHQCRVCRCSFFSETSLCRHMRKIHNGRFCCSLCKTTFRSKIDLKYHINTAHNAL